MSNRVLKKLHGRSNELDNSKSENHEISGSESDSIGNDKSVKKKSKKLAVNRFELLNSMEHNSMSDTEAKEDDDKDNETVTIGNIQSDSRRRLEKQDSTQSTDSMKRKKKKKKKMRAQKSFDDQLDDHLDDIELSVREVNRILGSVEVNDHHLNHKDDVKLLKKSVIYVESRHLNAENEMKRIFGSKVIQADSVGSNRRKTRGRVTRSWILVNPKNLSIVGVGKSGLTMEHVRDDDDVHYFNIVHNKSYQTAQFLFLDAVESFNPENLAAILNMHPYHIDTLIQFSDVCKMGEDHQMAAELIERALFCIEHQFHPLFNITQGNCRLDYKRPENRSFFIAIFKHLTFIGQRGCNRTALEFCKLLLGLDPEGDPLSVLLMIDYYAIRCEQYDYLISLYNEWDPIKKLSLLPNFRYSVPLAIYLKAQSDHSESTERADTLLQEALIMFPGLIMQLLDKCSVEPDAEVKRSDYFGHGSQQVPQAIAHLLALYSGRCYMLWKDRQIMSWLEMNVRSVLSRIKDKDPFIDVCRERRKKYFSQGTPRNVLRHIILSGIKDATTTLPPDISRSPIFGFDPLPPIDSIASYMRPEKKQNPNSNTNDGILSVFLRSWRPDFNMDEQRNHNDGDAAEGHETGGTNDLRRSVTSLLDAMRDLLSNIHMADVPNEGDVESDDDDDH